MKKTRFIPYGYTMRNGRTVIEHGEADIIRYIFDEYIKGASLKDLAEELTARKVPYTEKTEVFLHKHLETDAKVIEEAIQRRYHGSSWKALIVAYRDALKHYQRAMAAEAEEKGKKGDN